MSILAAIAFDPHIRGLLVVGVGVVVLIGSIYLILATNTGIRNGLLITLAALAGWCLIMGATWWMYGIGLRGADPTWIQEEINYTRDDAVLTEVVEGLPRTEDLSDPAEIYADYLAENPEVLEKVEAAEGEGYVPESLTKVATLIPELKVELDDELGDWRLLPESDARRGDAVAAADATLIEAEAFGEATGGGYTVHDVYFSGGKSAAEPESIPGEQNVFERVWNRVAQTGQVKNPPLYAAVTVQKNVEQTVAPGEAPPTPQADENAELVTVILQRDLGNRRLIPALFTIFVGILFAVFTWMLHTRDKRLQDARSNWDPSKAA